MKTWFSIVLAVSLSACPKAPQCPSRIDDAESEEERATGLDACARAGKRLEALHCKEARPDFADFCRHMTAEGVPLCPTKLARIQSCTEVGKICR